jgi:hypothetical protein
VAAVPDDVSPTPLKKKIIPGNPGKIHSSDNKMATNTNIKTLVYNNDLF